MATDPQKKLRNLKKKLRDIEALEEKLNSGEIPTPEKEQLDKVNLGNKGLITHINQDFLPDCVNLIFQTYLALLFEIAI